MQPTAPPGTPVAELLAADSRPVPGRLDERSFWDLGTADIDHQIIGACHDIFDHWGKAGLITADQPRRTRPL